jgi:hypothetical protein
MSVEGFVSLFEGPLKRRANNLAIAPSPYTRAILRFNDDFDDEGKLRAT